MSIVTVEVESIHGAVNEQRLIFYRAQDHLGVWHSYGPVVTVDPDFDIEAHKAVVSVSIQRFLEEQEFDISLEAF